MAIKLMTTTRIFLPKLLPFIYICCLNKPVELARYKIITIN